MSDGVLGVDVGEYCRRVEEHLARANDGHLIRIVGPAFEIVRGWAVEAVPLSIVFHGIDQKAARHRAGRSKRPLRLEFCEIDVRDAFDQWRRAVGIFSAGVAGDANTDSEPRKPSLSKHLDRAIDQLARAAGQLDRSEAFRDAVSQALEELSGLRDAVKSVRGAARAPMLARLPEIDARLVQAARSEAGDADLNRLSMEAAAELAAFRARLTPESWARSIELSVDRLLRDRLGLPTLPLDGAGDT